MRNSAFFLTPKAELMYIEKSSSFRQGVEKILQHKFLEMIIIDEEGRYIGVVSAKEFLMVFKKFSKLSLEDLNKLKLIDIKYEQGIEIATIDTEEDLLIKLADEQNIIPIVDESRTFIGLVRRAALLQPQKKRVRGD